MGWWEEDWDAAYPEGVTLSVVIPVFNERYLVEELIERVVAADIPRVARKELLVIDDGSTDGTSEVLDRLAETHADMVLIRQENAGKGAAVRTGIAAATGELIVIQDADLEYDPADLGAMVTPFFENGADAVYGSRFTSSQKRRVLYFRHSLGNRLITFTSNLFTDLNLTDVETCYKMFRAPILKSIPIRSNDFALEIELTAKAAKRGCRIFEVPISYSGRTYQEGKKIGWRDGIKAFATMIKYWVIDDLYLHDEYGAAILTSLERATRINRWIAETIRPHVGNRVLEVGAGIGNIARWLVPREDYVASDLNENYLHFLRNLAAGKPYVEVARIDVTDRSTFDPFVGRFDTVVCVNVLEHLDDPVKALDNLGSALGADGRIVLYVPRGVRLFSALDEALGHRRRYEVETLAQDLNAAGFDIEHVEEFNKLGRLAWWFNGKVRRNRQLSRFQLKLLDASVPIVRRIDKLIPGRGLGLVAAARRIEPGS